MFNIRNSCFALLTSVCLVGCGGGGGSDSSASNPPQESAVGIWAGSTGPVAPLNNPENILGIVDKAGQYWVFYYVYPNALIGFINGTGSISGKDFTSGNAVDFNFNGSGILPATVNAQLSSSSSFGGTIYYPSKNYLQIQFYSSYTNTFKTVTPVSNIAGSFSGYVGGVSPQWNNGFGGPATVALASDGSFSGIDQQKCTWSGNASNMADANILSITVTFGGSPCLLGTQTLSGVAYFDVSANTLFAAVMTSDRSAGFSFKGTKP